VIRFNLYVLFIVITPPKVVFGLQGLSYWEKMELRRRWDEFLIENVKKNQ